MLDSIRKRKSNILFTILIGAIVAVMALVGLGKIGNDAGSSAAAWVNGDPVTRGEFKRELEHRVAMLGPQFDERFVDFFKKATLDELVNRKLFSQQAKKLDLVVTDSELAREIRENPSFQKNGKFDYEFYQKIPYRGLLERTERDRLQIIKLQRYLFERVRLTPEEIRRAYQLKESKVDLDYAKIDFRLLSPSLKPTAKDVDAFLASTSREALEQYYAAHKADFSQRASVELQQIRVGLPYQASEAKRSEARKKADGIAKGLTAQNFSQIAKKDSDDEYAKKSGMVGWVARGTLEQPLETAIDGLAIGQVSGPIETPFGFFILKVLNKRDEKVQPVETVRRAIAEKLVMERLRTEWAEGKRKTWEASLAEGKSIEADLKALKVELKKTGPFSLGQTFVPTIGSSDAVMEAVFKLTKERPIAPKLFYYQDHYYFIRLRSMELAKPALFTKNEELVDKSLSTSLQTQVASDWLESLQKSSNIKYEGEFKATKASPLALN